MSYILIQKKRNRNFVKSFCLIKTHDMAKITHRVGLHIQEKTNPSFIDSFICVFLAIMQMCASFSSKTNLLEQVEQTFDSYLAIIASMFSSMLDLLFLYFKHLFLFFFSQYILTLIMNLRKFQNRRTET